MRSPHMILSTCPSVLFPKTLMSPLKDRQNYQKVIQKTAGISNDTLETEKSKAALSKQCRTVSVPQLARLGVCIGVYIGFTWQQICITGHMKNHKLLRRAFALVTIPQLLHYCISSDLLHDHLMLINHYKQHR